MTGIRRKPATAVLRRVGDRRCYAPAASLTFGHATVSLMVAKLLASGPQITLAAALKVVCGLLRRTIYGARYLSDEAYRPCMQFATAIPSQLFGRQIGPDRRHLGSGGRIMA